MQLPSPEKGTQPINFRSMYIVAQATLLDGDPALSKRGTAPQLSAHVYCGQTAGWIKIPLDTKVGICPGHILSDGDPAPPLPKGHSPQFFGPYPLRPNGCIDQDATCMEVGLGLGDFVLNGDPARPLNFRPMFITFIVILLTLHGHY